MCALFEGPGPDKGHSSYRRQKGPRVSLRPIIDCVLRETYLLQTLPFPSPKMRIDFDVIKTHPLRKALLLSHGR